MLCGIMNGRQMVKSISIGECKIQNGLNSKELSDVLITKQRQFFIDFTIKDINN